MTEAYTTLDDMLTRVNGFLDTYESTKANFPEPIQDSTKYLYTLKETLEYGLEKGFKPNDHLVTKFGMAAILMDVLEDNFGKKATRK